MAFHDNSFTKVTIELSRAIIHFKYHVLVSYWELPSLDQLNHLSLISGISSILFYFVLFLLLYNKKQFILLHSLPRSHTKEAEIPIMTLLSACVISLLIILLPRVTRCMNRQPRFHAYPV